MNNDKEKAMAYRYLAGYPFGGRVAGEKRLGERQKMRHHKADKSGRMYWCDCSPGWRSAGRIRFAGRSIKSFQHRHGAKRLEVWWRHRMTPNGLVTGPL